uniref:Uncharacterized protein n=1 Tax=Odontella aurita TaxID=265563 RepID=A0A7S4J1H5_9STRA
MGCCVSSPHTVRRYRDPADFDEEYAYEEDGKEEPLRTFGNFRTGGVVIPDDIDGLPSTWIDDRFPSDPNELLYDAEKDHGTAFRCLRPMILCSLTPCGIAYVVSKGLTHFLSYCTCDESCCHLRKEYSSRSHYRVYPNRIVVNVPTVRIPWGCFGCGSWNADKPVAHVFDRGAFGFRRVQCGVVNYVCCAWPVYGQAVARQRCPCNGPLWSGGWWCDEWMCDTLFCSYRYWGLADGDETAMASNLALQAYYEGRRMTKDDMDACLEYWRKNVAELTDPINRKRDVMCEPFCVPWYDCIDLYKCFHCRRQIPYKKEDDRTAELQEVYDAYEKECRTQVRDYDTFHGPRRNGTVCAALGCRRLHGRRGLIFCTEGLCDGGPRPRHRKGGDPPAPFANADWDDDNDAAKILRAALGDPPSNVAYRRWEKDGATGEYRVVTIRGRAAKERGKEAKETKEEATAAPAESGD